MTLNMKTYKGYEKKPYCNAHYPTTVASVVSDTPEMRRLAENTKLQSQVKYHEEFEKMKGRKTEIADDPEVMRNLQNSKVQSNVQYHGDLQRKLQQEANRPKEELTDAPSAASPALYMIPTSPTNGVPHSDSIPAKNVTEAVENSPYTQRLEQSSGTIIYSTDYGGPVPSQERPVGSIADYDPLNGNWGSSGAVSAAPQSQISPGRSSTKANGSSTASTKAFKEPAPAAAGPGRNTGFTVSFKENDIIVNCAPVDEGWMTGTVQRTLMWGMLPANYVERVNQPTGLFKLS
ncbi:Protein F42H10.3 b [Aphelenchoides avenae]|nr:Protein F42H10.3 b [Aphelenchus avenae]